MSNSISLGAIHHFTLTVTDVNRAKEFYAGLLGFQVLLEFGPRVLLGNGNIVFSLTLPPDPDKAIANDQFSENRVGLDHISFNMENLKALENAVEFFDKHNVPHGEIRDLGPDFGIYVLAFRDPDNIQLELTAPYT